jgi:hypothetical protein
MRPERKSASGQRTNPLAREVLHARWRAGRVAVVIG